MIICVEPGYFLWFTWLSHQFASTARDDPKETLASSTMIFMPPWTSWQFSKWQMLKLSELHFYEVRINAKIAPSYITVIWNITFSQSIDISCYHVNINNISGDGEVILGGCYLFCFQLVWFAFLRWMQSNSCLWFILCDIS